MYNADLKNRFLDNYSASTMLAVRRLFDRFEPYELRWNADLCTRTESELQEPLDQFLEKCSAKSRAVQLSRLRAYARWCMENRVPGACDGLLTVKPKIFQSAKKTKVSGPAHLQACLDKLYDPEEEDSVDLIYRGYFWLAFSGLPEEYVLEITSSALDFRHMTILYDGKRYPLYRESLLTFHKLAELKTMRDIHSNYTTENIPVFDRVPGDQLLRGVRSLGTLNSIRSRISGTTSDYYKKDSSFPQIGYARVWKSGFFYRLYEQERSGYPINFKVASKQLFADRKPANTDELYEGYPGQLQEDYLNWKFTFQI